MSQFLKFLQDRPDGIYVIATCNDVSGLPPEYIRAERWDTAPFMIDLPTVEEREVILDHYKDYYKVDGKISAADMEGWSGAEIKSMCRLASIENNSIDMTSQFVIPVAETMKDDIDRLRKWSVGKTINASEVNVNGDVEDRSIDI